MPSPNPATSTGNNTYDPVPIYKAPGAADNLSISPDGSVTLRRRMELLRKLDALPRQLDGERQMSVVDTFQRRAVEMLSSPRTREAFDLTREDRRTLDRYGDTHWGQSLLTCRRLVEAGVRFVQCQANFRLRPETGRTTNWDDHSVNSHIFKAYDEKLPSFDQSVSALIEDLYDRGLDRHVLFIFCGEFGRTPLIRNQDPSGRPGRDHWPRAMSVLLAGGGLRMGQVIGATEPQGRRAGRAGDGQQLPAGDDLSPLRHRYLADAARPARPADPDPAGRRADSRAVLAQRQSTFAGWVPLLACPAVFTGGRAARGIRKPSG